MFEFMLIFMSFMGGLALQRVGLPPLIGYLVAGFTISWYSMNHSIPDYSKEAMSHIAHIGVLLLLFTVGLKLNIKKLAKPEVIGGSVIHFSLTALIYAPICFYVFEISFLNSMLLASALGFSSTVIAAKILEDKKEMKAFHGRVAIGILVMQDIIAITIMSIASGKTPSIFSPLLLLLPLIRPYLFKVIDKCDHGEMLVLLSLTMAIIAGGYGFQLLGLSGELGALVMGALIANHSRSHEISKSVWNIKDLCLVAFFVSIGMNGLPTQEDLIKAAVLMVILPFKAILFFFLLIMFKLKSRSSFLTTSLLTNYSEFGLILTALLIPEWTMPLAIAVSLSFLIGAPFNRFSHSIYDRVADKLETFNRDSVHPDEIVVSLKRDILTLKGHRTEVATTIVFGGGLIGQSVYEELLGRDLPVILDSDQEKVLELAMQDNFALFADAEDVNFWKNIDLSNIQNVILTMSDFEAKSIAVKKLRKYGFVGLVIAHCMHQDEADKLIALGANFTYLTSHEVGVGLASHVMDKRAIKTEITTNIVPNKKLMRGNV